MNNLTRILVGGTAVFLGVSMIQERDTFWTGPPDRSQLPRDHAGERAAEDAVRGYITIARHAYESRGDPRFLERLPASDEVKAELADEIEYLERNGRVHSNVPRAVKVLATNVIADGFATVETAEQWEVQTRNAATAEVLEPPRVMVAYVRYRVARAGPRWRVVGWELIDPPRAPAAGDATAEEDPG